MTPGRAIRSRRRLSLRRHDALPPAIQLFFDLAEVLGGVEGLELDVIEFAVTFPTFRM
jgi:hypothetical protein